MLWFLLFNIYAFDLEIPRERDQVRARCEDAYPGALNNKELYENRVRVQCVHGLPGREMKDLQEGFVENCVATSNKRATSVGTGRISVDEDLIETMFNYVYTPIFQKKCMDRELSNFYRHQNTTPTGPAPHSPTIAEVYR